ncbi:hypothetical protein N7E81_05170 [Reichenbachiella carrageenanivorans]|uniref:Lipoprotein n=1 Tax=Reichenbachiella carrageenanivorans TaxID=2979869 RepID=A0ABY6D5Z4_9BACT|nr:hypothetical protein [Reichenbachiella carrageenanivorans]UXX80488.1 hypothetical protein N7E81_05170 [Reichenbachiella carrageenanivorans]
MKQLSILFSLLCIMFVLSSCSGDDDKDDDKNISGCSETLITEASEDYNEKLEAYQEDQSVENCKALQASINNLLDVYDEWFDCFGIDLGFDSEEYEKEKQDLDC